MYTALVKLGHSYQPDSTYNHKIRIQCAPVQADSSDVSALLSNPSLHNKAVKVNMAHKCALMCSADLDPSQCVNKAPLVASPK